MLLFLLVLPLVVANNYLYLTVDNSVNTTVNPMVTEFKIISDNAYYSDKYYPLLTEDAAESSAEESINENASNLSNAVYRLAYLFNDGKKMEIGRLDSKIAIPFYDGITQISVFYNDQTIFEKKISFCNHNTICEPCEGTDCTLMESVLTCSDCKSGGNDGICDLTSDAKCDPDCEGKDKDCSSCNQQLNSDRKSTAKDYQQCYDYAEETSCAEEGGEICIFGKVCSSLNSEMIGSLLCCKEGYCVTPSVNTIISQQNLSNNQLDNNSDNNFDNNDNHNFNNKNNDNNNSDFFVQQKSFSFYYILLAVVGIIIVLFSIYFLRKLYRSKEIIVAVQQLKQKYNYQEIKQQLLTKGFTEHEIDLAIEQHYHYDKDVHKTEGKKFKLFFFIFIAVSLFFLFTTIIHAEKITFAVISDTNVGFKSIALSTATEPAITAIVQDPRKIDLVIHLGNMIAGDSYLNKDIVESMWKEYDATVTEPLQEATIPLLRVGSQQDVMSDALIEYYRTMVAQKSPSFAGAQADGGYAFVYKKNLFIVLDTTQSRLSLDKKWLLDVFNKNYQDAEHVFVLSSMPFAPIDFTPSNTDNTFSNNYCTHCDDLFAALDTAAHQYSSDDSLDKITLISSGSNVYYKGDYKGYNLVSVGSLEEAHTLINTNERQKKSFIVINAVDGKITISALVEPFEGAVFNEALFPLIQPNGYTRYGETEEKQTIQLNTAGQSQIVKQLQQQQVQQQILSVTNPSCIIPSYLEGYDDYTQKWGNLDQFNQDHPEYEPIFKEAAQKFNVPYEIIKAIAIEETHGNVFPSKESKGGTLCNPDGNCLCNSAGACGIMQIKLSYGICSIKHACDIEQFKIGNPRDQIFAGAGLLGDLINGACKKEGKKLERTDPQFYLFLLGCYGDGYGGFTTFINQVSEKLKKPISQITVSEMFNFNTDNSNHRATLTIHGLMKQIRLDQCRKGIISDAVSQSVISSTIGINAPPSLGNIKMKDSLNTLYYITPNFKLPIDDSFQDYQKLRILTTGFVKEMHDCIALKGNIENCFNTLLQSDVYKKQGFVSNTLECQENVYEKLVYDIIEKIKNCKSKTTERCEFSLPNDFFYSSQREKNSIAFRFMQNDENTLFLTATINGLIYTNETIAGKLQVVENENNIAIYKKIKEITIQGDYDKNFFNSLTTTYVYDDGTGKVVNTINKKKNKFTLFYLKAGEITVLTDSLQQYDFPYLLPIAQNILTPRKSFTLCFISQKQLYAGNVFELNEENLKTLDAIQKPVTKLRSIIYRFSLQFGDDTIPPKIEFMANDVENAEKSVAVQFKPAKTAVQSYTVFVAQKKDDLSKPLEEIKKNTAVQKYIFDATQVYEKEEKKINELDSLKLYHDAAKDQLLVVVPVLENDKSYYFSIAATSSTGKEPNNIDKEQKIEIIEAKAIADIQENVVKDQVD